MWNVKLVFLGIGGIGKTSALIRYTTGTFPEEYVPTIFDNYSQILSVNGIPVNLGLWDTSARSMDYYYRLMPLSFPNTDVFFMGFAVDSQSSFDYLESLFFPLLSGSHPDSPFQTNFDSVPKFVVGLKADLRDQEDVQCIPREKAEALATEHGAGYLEFSALTNKGLKEAIETAVRACKRRETEKSIVSQRSRCAIL